MKILLSAVGTTDPVRGNRDGSMLHIARHYKPEVVVLFISEEMRLQEEIDNRYVRAFDMLAEHMGGYHPVIERVYLGKDFDVSDFNAPERKYREKICDCLNRYRENGPVEFLLNLSSGTTQLKAAWPMIAVEGHWKTRAVQVRTPLCKANQEENTLNEKYDFDFQLEFDEDNDPDAPNRTNEPDFSSIRRTLFGHQIYILINRFEYDSAYALFEDLGLKRENDGIISNLLAFTAARQNQNWTETKKALNVIPKVMREKIGYPAERSELYEYALLLLNLQRSNKVSEFVFRLNPFIVRLAIRYLEVVCKMPPDSYLNRSIKGGYCLSSEKMNANYPELLRKVQNSLNLLIDNREVSQYTLHAIIANTPEADKSITAFFDICAILNNKRNSIAHDFYAMNEKDVAELTGQNTQYFIDGVIDVLCATEAGITKQSFSTFNPYLRMNKMIEELLFSV